MWRPTGTTFTDLFNALLDFPTDPESLQIHLLGVLEGDKYQQSMQRKEKPAQWSELHLWLCVVQIHNSILIKTTGD